MIGRSFRHLRPMISGRRFVSAGIDRYEGEPKVLSSTFLESAQVSIDRDYLAQFGNIKAGKELRKQVRQLEYEGIPKLRVRAAEGGAGRHFDLIPVLDKKVVFGSQDDTMRTNVMAQLKEDLTSIPVVKSVEVNSWQTNPVEDEPLLHLGGGSSGAGHKAGTDNKLWASEMIGLDTSWNLSRGGGVLVAHPDTGYIQHPELNNVIESIDYDFYDEDENPEDADGSHGLGTGSVIVSRHSGEMYGGAPSAMLVPMRVSAPGLFLPGVVLLSWTRLRKAIDSARQLGCDVVSISLGGPTENTGLHNAIKAAYNEGMIIVAAGGNYTLYLPIYPANYEEVIGCSACNIDKTHWFNSAWGDHVEVSAPGESVWRAVYDKSTPTVSRGHGTSYATTHIASLAALWISKHGGRTVLKHRCAAAGLAPRAIGDEFRKILRSTAQSSPGLHKDYGPLVDAKAVLEATLSF